MHRNALRAPQIPSDGKHKFGVMCTIVLFVKSVPVPPDYENYCVDISCPKRTGMHYVTHRSHQMQKHKFSVTCSGALFLESVPVPPDYEN
jgi:hypothetical protein